MTASKDKGTKWERDVSTFLTERGFRAVRVAQHGVRDVGDIHVEGQDLILEAKDWRDVASALREGTEQAVREARNAKRKYGFAVVKRARKPVSEAYVVMTLEQLVSMMEEWRDRN
jgi:hypothetical protein